MAPTLQWVLGLDLLQRRIGIFDHRIDSVGRIALQSSGKIFGFLSDVPVKFLIFCNDSVVLSMPGGGCR